MSEKLTKGEKLKKKVESTKVFGDAEKKYRETRMRQAPISTEDEDHGRIRDDFIEYMKKEIEKLVNDGTNIGDTFYENTPNHQFAREYAEEYKKSRLNTKTEPQESTEYKKEPLSKEEVENFLNNFENEESEKSKKDDEDKEIIPEREESTPEIIMKKEEKPIRLEYEDGGVSPEEEKRGVRILNQEEINKVLDKVEKYTNIKVLSQEDTNEIANRIIESEPKEKESVPWDFGDKQEEEKHTDKEIKTNDKEILKREEEVFDSVFNKEDADKIADRIIENESKEKESVPWDFGDKENWEKKEKETIVPKVGKKVKKEEKSNLGKKRPEETGFIIIPKEKIKKEQQNLIGIGEKANEALVKKGHFSNASLEETLINDKEKNSNKNLATPLEKEKFIEKPEKKIEGKIPKLISVGKKEDESLIKREEFFPEETTINNLVIGQKISYEGNLMPGKGIYIFRGIINKENEEIYFFEKKDDYNKTFKLNKEQLREAFRSGKTFLVKETKEEKQAELRGVEEKSGDEEKIKESELNELWDIYQNNIRILGGIYRDHNDINKLEDDKEDLKNWYKEKVKEINNKYYSQSKEIKDEKQLNLVEEKINELKKEEKKIEIKIHKRNLKIKWLLEQAEGLPDEQFSTEFIKRGILPLLEKNEDIDEIKSFDIKGIGKEIILDVLVKSFGFNIRVQVTFENKGNDIIVKSQNIDAKWPAKGKAEKALTPQLNKVSELLKSYIEKENGKKVGKIWIEDGELKVLYTKS